MQVSLSLNITHSPAEDIVLTTGEKRRRRHTIRAPPGERNIDVALYFILS